MKKLLFISLTILSLAGLNGCAKKGCTDPFSDNYDSSAKKDDGSCKYSEKIIFWYNQTSSENAVADGYTSLEYYVDGRLIGSSSVTVYNVSQPTCDQNGAAHTVKDLGTNPVGSATWQVKDGTTGDILFEGTLNINRATDGPCRAIELVY